MEYVNEDELKSAIIRLNNGLKDVYSANDLKRLRKYIDKVKSKKLKSQRFKRALRAHIVRISERNAIDHRTFEEFGEMITLVIKNMLKKPNFSGYTYRDEFYSDTCYKILKYIKNFNHKMISQRSGQSVSAFAYVTQIVKNSLIFIIEQKKDENIKMRNMVSLESHEKLENVNESTYDNTKEIIELVIYINEVSKDLVSVMKKYLDKTEESIIFEYNPTYKISLDEYEKIIKLRKEYNRNIVVTRRKLEKQDEDC